jgi:hypothetical protein
MSGEEAEVQIQAWHNKGVAFLQVFKLQNQLFTRLSTMPGAFKGRRTRCRTM